ncbi:MAG: SsrA-binding protein SmpB, partial [Bacteroidota bacterium]
MSERSPVIKNRKAAYDYHLLQSFTAGMVLTGSEVKSIRNGEVNLGDAYCTLEGEELYIRNMYVKEFAQASHYNHDPKRTRKLLLNRHELKKIALKLKEKGTTLVPIQLFFNEKGYVKLEIALAKGKKSYDKRE